MDLLGYQQPQHSQGQWPTAVMMAMHSLGVLQVLVRQMQPGADHQNPEVHVHIQCCAILTYTNTGITIAGIQSGVPILIGDSVTITCTTDSSADSITLLQDGQVLHGTVMQSTTTLTYTISFVSDSIHGNTFKCEANFVGTSDTAFVNATATIKSKLYS